MEEVFDDSPEVRNTVRGAGRGRRRRVMDDRAIADDRSIQDEDQFGDFDDFSDLQPSVLPTLPEIPGYHLCYVSKEHAGGDTPHARMRQGYQYVTREDLPNFEHFNLNHQDDGVLSVKEMVAMKIETAKYHRLMQFNHHFKPRKLEEGINSAVETIADTVRRSKGRVYAEDGVAQMGHGPRIGKFDLTR